MFEPDGQSQLRKRESLLYPACPELQPARVQEPVKLRNTTLRETTRQQSEERSNLDRNLAYLRERGM